MKRIVVMCSGGGSNLQNILDGCAQGRIQGRVVQVISSAAKAYALTRAERAGVPGLALPKARFDSPEAMHRARHQALVAAQPDLIVLAGYLGILPPQTIAAFSGRILNIHPALIPSFCGQGMYGHHVHEAVLAYGAKLSGATVHFVSEEIDGGPVVMQESVPVLDDDTPDSLAARVLTVEHRLLPEAVRLFCEDRLRIEGRRVFVDGGTGA